MKPNSKSRLVAIAAIAALYGGTQTEQGKTFINAVRDGDASSQEFQAQAPKGDQASTDVAIETAQGQASPTSSLDPATEAPTTTSKPAAQIYLSAKCENQLSWDWTDEGIKIRTLPVGQITRFDTERRSVSNPEVLNGDSVVLSVRGTFENYNLLIDGAKNDIPPGDGVDAKSINRPLIRAGIGLEDAFFGSVQMQTIESSAFSRGTGPNGVTIVMDMDRNKDGDRFLVFHPGRNGKEVEEIQELPEVTLIPKEGKPFRCTIGNDI